MPDLKVRAFSELLAEQARAAQAFAPPGRTIDFSKGSVFRALATSFATLGLWLQGMILRTLANTRAATSSGSDLHSWMLDFGLTPTAGTKSKGLVTFGRHTPGLSAVIPAVTTTVRTADGAWTYRVVADTAHPQWSFLQNGYAVPAGIVSVDLPVEALVEGSGGNADNGTITLLSSSVPGIDYVRNPSRLAGGEEPETDDAFRGRFRAYIASLPSGVRPAIEFAIQSVQPGLSWSILPQISPDGTARAAHFTVVVDDGTGVPPASLMGSVTAAIEPVRALGVSYAVIPPERTLADVTMALTITREADSPSVIARVTDALEEHINGLPLGTGLSFTRLSLISYTTAPNEVVNISQVSLNNSNLDIPPSPRQAVRSGQVSVTATPLPPPT